MAVLELEPSVYEETTIYKRRPVGPSDWQSHGACDRVSERHVPALEIVHWVPVHPTSDVPAAPAVTPRARRILRGGILLLVCLVLVGVGLLALGGPVGSAVGFALLYSGVLVLLVAQYAFGLETGSFPIGPRYSILAIVAFLGLVMTSLVAAVEQFLAR